MDSEDSGKKENVSSWVFIDFKLMMIMKIEREIEKIRWWSFVLVIMEGK